MVDQDILLEKAGIIQRCLKRITTVTEGQADKLNDLDVQDITVLNLQRAIQAALDMAAHVIVEENLGLPESMRDHFTRLKQHKIIDTVLGTHLEAMAGFRNIVIHEYQNLDIDILKQIVTNSLQDLELFYKTILNRRQE